MIVGGYAVGFHGVPRYTKDLDLWVRPNPKNAARVYHALAEFGAPLGDLTPDDLCDPEHILQIGVEPVRIDILAGVPGLAAEEAFPRAVEASFGGVPVRFVARDDLIAAKLHAGRPQDLLDVEILRGRDPR